MPKVRLGDSSIRYEESGSGFPMLLLAPGALSSTVEIWERVAVVNPLKHDMGEFLRIAMDQRNAGESVGPFETDDPWGSYMRDQLALMDHLGHERFAIFGYCVGASYALSLMKEAPERVAAAVMAQPVGRVEGGAEMMPDEMWQRWVDSVLERQEGVTVEELEAFGDAMWNSGDFVLSVTRDDVRAIETPMLVLPGTDIYHPPEIALEIAELAPNAELLDPWKDTPEQIEDAKEVVREFLARTVLA